MKAPVISAIVSLVDHRDEAVPCIESLTRGQNASAEDFEILAVSDGSEPEMDDVVKSSLRSNDHFLIEPTRNEYRLFNVGSEAARGEIVLVIESHCIAAVDFISEFLEAFRDPELLAARCRSVGVAESVLESYEKEEFERSFEVGLRQTSWNRVLIHGFAIRRKLFDEIGGFRTECENFGPWEMGAKLDRLGVEIGYLENAIVHHRYMGDETDLRDFIVRFCRGEWEYRTNGDRSLIRDYFPRIPEWESQGQSCALQARRVFFSTTGVRLIAYSAVRSRRIVFLWTLGLAFRRLSRPARICVFQLLGKTHASWRLAEATEKREDFKAFWKRCVDLGRWTALCENRAAIFEKVETGRSIQSPDIEPRSLYGWRESDPEEQFRWVEPLCALSVILPPDARSIVFDFRYGHPERRGFRMQMGLLGIVGKVLDKKAKRVSFDLPGGCASKNVTLVFWFPPILEPETMNYLGAAIEAITFES